MSVAVSRTNRQPRRRDQRGAAVVEFSIASVLLLVLLFGIISYGYVLSFKQGLTQAAAEGARAAAVVSLSEAADTAALAVEPALKAFDKDCTSAGMDCSYSTDAADTGCATGTSCIRVRVAYDYDNHPLLPKFPGLGLLLPDTLSSTSIARVN